MILRGRGKPVHHRRRAEPDRSGGDPRPPGPRFSEGSGHARVLDVMRADSSGADWFYLSPPTAFGSRAPGEATGSYRLGSDVLLTDQDGDCEISGADYVLAVVDEIDTPRHHRTRFTVAH